jgi:hypothetical protein
MNRNKLFKTAPDISYDPRPEQHKMLKDSLYVTHNNILILRPNPILLPWFKLTDESKFILQMEYSHLTTRIAYFYCLPKVHKGYDTVDDIKGRPIVSSFNSATYHSSKYVDIVLNKLVKSLETNLKNSTTLLLQIQDTLFPVNSYIMTADVTALYPSIDIEDGLRMLYDMLQSQYGNGMMPEIKNNNDILFVVQLTELVLKNNYVQFGDRMWKQLQGTAMGTPLAVVFANIYMTALHLECIKKCLAVNRENPFSKLSHLPPLVSDIFNPPLHYTISDRFFILSAESQLQIDNLIVTNKLPIIPPNTDNMNPYDAYSLYERFIDDICSIWKDKFSPLIYITVFNSLRPTIKLTYEISYKGGIMMDLRIFKGDDFHITPKFSTELYQKPMNKFTHLPYISYHESYEPTVKAELIRIRLHESIDSSNDRKRFTYKKQLFARGYPLDILDVWFNEYNYERHVLLSKLTDKIAHDKLHPRKHDIPLLFKITHCRRSILLKLTQYLKRNTHFDDPIYDKIIPKDPMLCKKGGPNLGSYLCSSKSDHSFTDADFAI